MVNKLPAKAGDIKDGGSIPKSGRSPGGGHDSPLQDSCLERPMVRETWWATVMGWQSRTRLKRPSPHTQSSQNSVWHMLALTIMMVMAMLMVIPHWNLESPWGGVSIYCWTLPPRDSTWHIRAV